jgi:hypothetical protein
VESLLIKEQEAKADVVRFGLLLAFIKANA